MRWLLWLLCFWPVLAWGAPTELTAEQRKVVEKLADFYKTYGEKERGQALKDGLEAGNIEFGPTQANANAQCDMSDDKRPIRINPSVVDKINQGNMEGWRETANLANTLSHELVHRQQDRWAWRGAFWSEVFGQGNACEQEAWGHSLEKWQAWLAKTHQELKDKANAGTGERAEIGQRLKMLSEACQVQINDLKLNGAAIGKPRMCGPDGVPMTVDELSKAVVGYQKLANSVVGTSTDFGTNHNGIYKGTLEALDTHAQIAIKIDGYTVSGRISGRRQQDPFEGEIRGSMDADGNLRLKVWDGMATVLWNNVPTQQSLSGQFTGVVGKNSESFGRFSLNTGQYTITGNWSAVLTR